MENISASKFTTILSLSLLLFLALPSPSLGALKCNPNDAKALLEVKKGLNNPEVLDSWVPNTDCCSWFGVFCDTGIGRVVGLRVFNRNVSGEISPAIGKLRYIQNIDFSFLPNLTGTIPRSITKLTRMNVLILTRNQLSGPIPSYLGKLKSLSALDLSVNHFSGSIPASFSKLSNLINLSLNDNDLCGEIPQGGILQSIPPRAFANNKCLCGAPLPACS